MKTRFSFFAAVGAVSALIASAPSLARAQSVLQQAHDFSKEKLGEVQQAIDEIPSQRAAKPFTFSIDGALFETWVITKYGLTFSYAANPENVYELEYLRGGLGFGFFGMNLGQVEEQKVSLLWRSYKARNTFSFFSGVTYNQSKLHLGSDFLETVTGSQQANADIAEISTLGPTWGFGQRWHTRNGTVWGVDWFNVTLPLIVLTEHTPFTELSNSQDKRSQVNNAANLFKHFPALGILKFQIGYSF